MSQNVFSFAVVAHDSARDPMEMLITARNDGNDGGGIRAANPLDELRFIRRAMACSTMSIRLDRA
jgi:hypothetical protein